MKFGWKTWVAVGLTLALVCVGVATRDRWWPHPRVTAPEEGVPASWAQFKTSTGHEAHLKTGKVTCSDCHDLARDGFKNPGSAPCARCHATEAKTGHGGKVEAKAECLTCHVFAPTEKAPVCMDCHAKAEGKLPGIVHHKTDCASCHRPHQALSIVAADCTSCHKERAPEHAAHAGSQACADCHNPHESAAVAEASCVGCHEQARQAPAAGHPKCEGCHEPHSFVATGTSTCVGCHGNKPTLLASTEPKHAICISCHAPHDPGSAASSCKGCHQDVSVAHGSQGACVSCHKPHPANPLLKVQACTTCHGAIANADTKVHGPGLSCDSCHHPHDFTPPRGAGLCVTCHATETARAASSQGHRVCATCHGTDIHRPVPSPGCATCHKAEASSAPPGHQACVSCHEPHSATQKAGATCVTCHAKEAKGNHESVKAGCATCHRPHGPGGPATPPGCVTCHARATLPALHSVAAHANCASCHSSHGPTRSDRATCTTGCHADRRTHQTDAPVCSGCHVFQR